MRQTSQAPQCHGRRLIHRDELDRSLDPNPFAYATDTGRDNLEARFQSYIAGLRRGANGTIAPDLLCYRACPLCHSQDSKPQFVKYDFPIHRCPNCQFTFANPILSPDQALVLETGELAEDHLTFITQDFYKRCAALRFEYELQQALRHHSGVPSTLLEIGSSVGTGLTVARSYHLQPVGIEPSARAAQLAREGGHEVIAALFTAALFPTQRFDLVMSMDVLEHVPDPIDFLTQIRFILNPDGILLLQVPNAGGLITLVEGKENQIYNGLFHLNYFNCESLDRAAHTAGFKSISTSTILSELGKLTKVAKASIQDVLDQHRPDIAASYRPHQDWINDHSLGYKIIGLYRAQSTKPNHSNTSL